MKIMILGATGMLGHKLFQVLSEQHETIGTTRRPIPDAWREVYADGRLVTPVMADDASVGTVLAAERPDVVVNCVGVVKQLRAGKDPETCIAVNALFPHVLARHCRTCGARLVHISTDCVFTGRQGGYLESDVPDADDLYGITKCLGEVCGGGALTIRTSIIGRELYGAHGLIEWFLAQRGGRARGFRKALFSGFPTVVLATVIERLICECPKLEGLWHVAADPISKFDLLSLVNDVYGLGVTLEEDDAHLCDRSLNGQRFVEQTGIVAPPWAELIETMHDDATPYVRLRGAVDAGS